MKIFGKSITWTTIATFIVTAILLGILNKFGEDIYDSLKTYDYQNLSDWGQRIIKLLTKTVEIQIINILVISIAAIPIYKLINKYIVPRLFSETIFNEDFSSSANFWAMNYWGSTNANKTNRIENNKMIFEALPTEWSWSGSPGQGGAYYDLRTGIVKGLNYVVECKVKSTPSTTMRFQLWLHDTVEQNSVRGEIETPPTDNFKIYRLKFKATDSRAIRIHLHCFAGQGQIIVDEVKVVRK